MIKSLSLVNFQKHRKLRIDLDEHVTTIVGRTGSGKSCVVRGLKLALLNRGPTKPARNRKGVATVRVRLGSYDLTRRKGDKTNSYTLSRKAQHRKYKAFGLGKTPPAVANAAKTQEINFQGQHDPAYWFTLTPGQVSKQLNRIVNLDVIDRVLDRAASEVRKANARAEVSKERLTEAKKERDRLAWAEEMALDFADLQQKNNDLAAVAIKRSVLRGLCLEGQDAYSTSDLASKAILCALRAVESGRRLASVKGRRAELKTLVVKVKELTRLSQIAVPGIENIRNIRAEADKASEDRRALEYLVTQTEEARKQSWQIQEQLDKVEGRMKKVKVCPTCGRPMSSPSLPATSTPKKKLL